MKKMTVFMVTGLLIVYAAGTGGCGSSGDYTADADGGLDFSWISEDDHTADTEDESDISWISDDDYAADSDGTDAAVSEEEDYSGEIAAGYTENGIVETSEDTYYGETSDTDSYEAGTQTYAADDMSAGYSIEDIAYLNGVFCYDPADGTLSPLTNPLDHCGNIEYEDMSRNHGYLMNGDGYVPVIHYSNGEKLILVGEEGANRAPSSQDSINVYSLNLLGYGNRGVQTNDAYDELEEISGDGVWTWEYNNTHDMETLILADNCNTMCNLSYYSGTQYVTDTVCLSDSYYIVDDYEAYETIPVVKTHDGYFEVDLSGLSAGSYILNGYSGFYAFTVE